MQIAANRACALAQCMADQRDACKGLHLLASCLNLWAELGFTCSAILQPLVHAAVSIRCATLMSAQSDALASTSNSIHAAKIEELPSLTSMTAPSRSRKHRSRPSDASAAPLSARLEASGAQGLALPVEMLGAVLKEEVREWVQMEANGMAGAGMCWQEAERGLQALLESVHPRSSDPVQHARALLFRARCRLCHAAHGRIPDAQDSSGADVVDSAEADLAIADELLQGLGDEGTPSDSAVVHAMLALHLAAEARCRCSAATAQSGAECPAEAPVAIGWLRAVDMRSRAVDRVSESFSSDAAAEGALSAEPEGATSDDLLQMMMELRYLAALQGSAREQQQLDTAILTAARSQQDSLSDAAFSALGNSPSGCAAGFILAPQVHPSLLQACFGESMSGQPFSLASFTEQSDGRMASAEQLRQMAADAAAQLSKGPCASLQRGLLHLLAAAQAHREGTSSLPVTAMSLTWCSCLMDGFLAVA